jgi:hypothetical protein
MSSYENGVKILSLSDTTGVSTPEKIKADFTFGLIKRFEHADPTKNIEIRPPFTQYSLNKL